MSFLSQHFWMRGCAFICLKTWFHSLVALLTLVFSKLSVFLLHVLVGDGGGGGYWCEISSKRFREGVGSEVLISISDTRSG